MSKPVSYTTFPILHRYLWAHAWAIQPDCWTPPANGTRSAMAPIRRFKALTHTHVWWFNMHVLFTMVQTHKPITPIKIHEINFQNIY